MAEPILRLSGTVLASLMFQHVNSDSDMEGFILGESRVDEQVTISDSQSDHIHIEEVYNIQKHIACHRLNALYASSGEVNMDALQNMLAKITQDKVIGWYRQRRHTEQHVTFREKLVHEKLKSALSNPHLIFMLLTSSKVTPTGSTHRMEYSAFISRNRCLVNIPVLVTNLGLLEQQAYWKVPALCSAAGYNLTMKKHGSKFFASNGLLKEVNEVNKMNESLQAELQKMCRDVEESECAVEALQAEVSALKKKLEEKRKTAAGKATETCSPPEPRNNTLLLQAVEALFGSAPMLLTQTLNLQACPVPDEHGPTAEMHSDTVQESLNSPQKSPAHGQKRQGERLLGRKKKLTRSKS
ncbi:BRCA1-A complex subunit Abraxas 1 [Austrofundulus limnaeus]|uniref:BRCA1-A complex subunit Abraxas 1 n=1 Tax=Austrofundulus limnaeus TaxID=52670 RepID=A0A2I4ARZ1_AUSLI|nr:PREDICTED: BRCA1-A complex subunit Abraxas [Austrofundulus limnaeus]